MSAILCVDDEEFVLKALSQDLGKHFKEQYLIELAQSAEDAFEILDELKEEGVQVVVIISDWMMPGMKGDEFLIEAHKKFPKVIKIMLTGQADRDAIKNAEENADMKRAFSKPWDSSEIIAHIEEELGKIDE